MIFLKITEIEWTSDGVLQQFGSLPIFWSLREMPEGRCVSFAIPSLIIPLSRPFFPPWLAFISGLCGFIWIYSAVGIIIPYHFLFALLPAPFSSGGCAKAKISFLLFLLYFVLRFGFFTIDEGYNCGID